ncbi:ribulokinase [Paenactinomyces guangxiensis]|uniref:Ribulokinase n=1 Tax=Paenactinomyces guangxiensis TaxID=1490290 RepID=A0A7W2A659_9BACL|nr:ribulokinase [Paenactinomyces guangxiensis]MBA4493036.1 ribulokinase [Paenactinomyces guangxiensis]MBH8590115.1 ribulokinase [Paenactinomyces guangxiensis]
MRLRYSIGVDYGTESARAVLVNLTTGEVVASAVKNYPDGVITDELPGLGVKLEQDWALQNPNDYIEVFVDTISSLLLQTKNGVSPADIIGIGIDFTSCTMLPVKQDGTPLCNLPVWRNNPHSWVKLWKHHAAQEEANRLNEVAKQMNDSFLPRYGGKISSEWLFPKIWQILNEAPELYEAADRFIEAGDWLVWQLTGRETRNACTAGYKAIWHKQKGYPDKDFFKKLDLRLENVVDEKLSRDILPLGAKAGKLTRQIAEKTGLPTGIAVAAANVDAHVSAPAASVIQPGQMLMIMGTSTCDILLGTEEKMVPGMCGVVEDGAIPGYFAYEAGQSAVGDIFAWFVENGVPPGYHQEAHEKGINIHQLLEEKAALLQPGESGLLALDWHNGNRSVLVDADLSGLILGCTLDTKPEEIYRALIEATAYGKRLIIETFEQHGVPVNQLVACGGLPYKNKMLMQIYADVIGKEVFVAEHLHTPAVGSAMFGAVAAGKTAGGFDTIVEAAEKIAKVKPEKIKPIKRNVAVYEFLYQEYKRLHDYFGRGDNNVMKRLKQLKRMQEKE